MWYLTFLILAFLGTTGFIISYKRAVTIGNKSRLSALPYYYGHFSLIWISVPFIITALAWSILSKIYINRSIIASLSSSNSNSNTALLEIYNIASGAIPATFASEEFRDAAILLNDLTSASSSLLPFFATLAGCLGFAYAYYRISATFKARAYVERIVRFFLVGCAATAILITIGIICSLLFESYAFFKLVAPWDFFFGLKWSPQTALRADQVASSGAFGAIPLFVGTFLIAFIAMLVATPIGLLSAVYLTEYTSPLVRKIVKPILEMLAGIPTVVYGFFAAITVAPFIRDLGTAIGMDVSSESALAAGLVMGIMIIPFVLSLSDDIINAVPQSLRDASYALGATKSETIKQVILPAALPGIASAVLLALSRAVGETMIVVMAAGLAAKLTFNPFENVTTVTVQIVTALVGDQEFDSAKTLSVFALGLVLFFITLVLNLVSLKIVNHYREIYE